MSNPLNVLQESIIHNLEGGVKVAKVFLNH